MRFGTDTLTTDAPKGSSHLAGEPAAMSGEKPRIVTTSWDDGDPDDLKIAGMLADFNLPGTFYIPVKGHHKSSRMKREEVLALGSQGFEIGGHGISHPNLSQCNEQRLAVEVELGKKRLEDELGKKVTMFAYPRGRYSERVIACVKQAGFKGARTTAMLARELAFDPFRMPTSVQAFPHSGVAYSRNLARARDFSRAWKYLTGLRHAASWVELAMLLFDNVFDEGGVWHLYGHSWEIRERGLWDELSAVMDYVSARPGVVYLPNSALVGLGATQPGGKAAGHQQPVL